MNRNLRSIIMGSTALLSLLPLTADGEGDAPAGGAGAAAPAAEPAAAPAAEPAAGAEGDPAGGDGGAAAAEPAAGAAGAEGEPAQPPKTTRRPWYEKRIDNLTASQRTAEEAATAARADADAARRQVAAYEALYGKQGGAAAPAAGAAPAPAAAAPADGRVYTAAEVQTEAARIASIQNLNQRLDAMFDEGVATHGDEFKQRVTQAQAAFGQELGQRMDLFSALADLPNAAAVYNELVGDLDHFAEVMTMDPVRLGMELARISTKAGAKPKGPKVSGAPAPIEPLGGGPTADASDLTKVPMEDYAKTRAAQREARFKERGYH